MLKHLSSQSIHPRYQQPTTHQSPMRHQQLTRYQSPSRNGPSSIARTRPQINGPYRAGIILYDPDTDDFGFAIDAKYLTYIDFGGHVEPTDDNLRTTACREAYEETYGVINLDPSSFDQCVKIISKETIEYIIPVLDRDEVTISINDSINTASNLGYNVESIGLVWIPRRRLKEILSVPDDQLGDYIYPPIGLALKEYMW